MVRRSPTSSLWPLPLTLVLSLALVLAACGGGGGGDDETPTAEAGPTATEGAPTKEASSDSVELDVSFWHAGFYITLEEASLAPGAGGSGVVTVTALFENLSEIDYTFDSQVALTSGGVSYGEESLDEDLPLVPAGLTGRGAFAFEVDSEFSLDDATLIAGGPEVNQAIVPIGPNSTEDLVDLEPLQLDVTGSATAGAVTGTVTGVEVRADLPDWRQEVEEGQLSLTVFFDVSADAGLAQTQRNFQNQNVALRLPDGTAIAVRSDGRSGVNEILEIDTTNRNLSVRFIIDEPPEGEYAFIVRGPFGADRAQVEDEVVFTIPAQ